MSQVQNLSIQGFTGEANTDVVATFRLRVTEDDGTTPFDLTDATSSFKAKKSFSDTSALISVSTADGITIDTDTATMTLRLTVEHLAAVALNRESVELVYDWDFRNEDGELFRPIRGTLTIGGDI